MDWLDEHLKKGAGSICAVWGNPHQTIARIADEALDGNAMARIIREEFGSQKAFGEFLGVGESTVAGWMKSATFPDYAKRATVAAFFADRNRRALTAVRSNSNQPKVVQDGERFLVVQFETDQRGAAVGTVLARDIVDKDFALASASARRAWELLAETEKVLEEEIEARSGFVETDHLEFLKRQISLERPQFARAAAAPSVPTEEVETDRIE